MTGTSDNTLPAVTVIVPMLNEEQHIRACAENLLTQSYPPELVTILLIDGRSQDKTRDVVAQLQTDYPKRRIKLLDNPQRGVAAALNVGIQAANDDIIIRMDAHSVPEQTFIEKSVKALSVSGAAYAGGIMKPEGSSAFAKAVAVALNHPLGAGGAKFHTATQPQFTDTVYLGAFRKTIFDQVGLFNEALVCNEDYELNTRIRKAGQKIYLDPSIQTAYTPRDTPAKLWKQYFSYGWWKLEMLKLHPDSLKPRQLAPALFVKTILLLLLLSFFLPAAQYMLSIIIVLYLIILMIVALQSSRKLGLKTNVAVQIPLAVSIMHIAWGSGFFSSLINSVKPGSVARL